MTRHQFYDRADGLNHCKVCNGAEGSLPTHCPGVPMTPEQDVAVEEGRADFVNGFWVGLANPSLAMLEKRRVMA